MHAIPTRYEFWNTPSRSIKCLSSVLCPEMHFLVPQHPTQGDIHFSWIIINFPDCVVALVDNQINCTARLVLVSRHCPANMGTRDPSYPVVVVQFIIKSFPGDDANNLRARPDNIIDLESFRMTKTSSSFISPRYYIHITGIICVSTRVEQDAHIAANKAGFRQTERHTLAECAQYIVCGWMLCL